MRRFERISELPNDRAGDAVPDAILFQQMKINGIPLFSLLIMS
jgi:hypothetical protein